MGYSNSEKTRTFSQYKRTDILIWVVISVFFEWLISIASSRWFANQPYILQLAPALTSIVFMRWGFWGLIVSFVCGIEYALINGGIRSAVLVYGLGNLFSVISVLFLLSLGKEKIRNNTLLTIAFTVVTALSMQLGRACVSMLLGLGIKQAADYILTDTLSGVFAVVLVLLCKKLDGLFEDQKSYLIRINEEGDKDND